MATSQTDFLPLAIFPPAVARLDRRAIADRWAGACCLLNGKPAQISGRVNDFATVRTLGGGVCHEWTWDAVNRIMTEGGARFYS